MGSSLLSLGCPAMAWELGEEKSPSPVPAVGSVAVEHGEERARRGCEPLVRGVAVLVGLAVARLVSCARGARDEEVSRRRPLVRAHLQELRDGHRRVRRARARVGARGFLSLFLGGGAHVRQAALPSRRRPELRVVFTAACLRVGRILVCRGLETEGSGSD